MMHGHGGDDAQWQQTGEPLQSLSLVVVPATDEFGAVIEQRVELQPSRTQLSNRPTRGEAVTVLGGRWKGSYTVDQVIDDDGDTWRVAVL